MSAKVHGRLRGLGFGQQCVKIRLEHASRNAALCAHQFDNVFVERRQVVKRRQWIENDVERLPDSLPFPAAQMGQDVVDVRLRAEGGHHRAHEILKIEFDDVACRIAEAAGTRPSGCLCYDQNARTILMFGEETGDDVTQAI